MVGAGRGRADRRLTMNDALSYVREVKDSFSDQPEKYKMFLKIMKDFKTGRINRARVVAIARELFKGHDGLVYSFNVFLPDECQIAALYEPPAEDQPVTYEEAVRLIDKIKERFQNEERVCDEFFHILYLYRLGKEPRAVYYEVDVV
ncbi:hypothetical protein ACJRO7_005094 [Eucalyptus globulus]|uniref:Uncharacterized protein n=1 Tax=Eucalyptus globulus TaxID=34317 RepID=A0ABD3J0Q6_EUCGL